MTPLSVSPLRVVRRFAARRERLFRAWTEPQELARWFHPGPDYENTLATVDLRVGGRYRLGMRAKKPDAPLHLVGGVYEEISPPDRLVFTWSWEGEHTDEPEMRVTLEFLPRGDETELVLTQEPFVKEETKTSHDRGWTGCLGQLEAFLETTSTRERRT